MIQEEMLPEYLLSVFYDMGGLYGHFFHVQHTPLYKDRVHSCSGTTLDVIGGVADKYGLACFAIELLQSVFHGLS